MKIGILGADGFLGKALCKQFPDAVQITRGNYISLVGSKFDVFINANGNSKKYWAEKAPLEDFKLSTVSVYKTFAAFNIKHYIYISSVDAAFPEYSIYGFHKDLSEQIVAMNSESYLILRCCAMIGKDMSKGVVKDLVKGNPLWIKGESKMQFITVSEVAKIVDILIRKNEKDGEITIGGKSSIFISSIAKMIGVKFTEKSDAIIEHKWNNVFRISNIYTELKTSKQYIREFINERMEQPV